MSGLIPRRLSRESQYALVDGIPSTLPVRSQLRLLRGVQASGTDSLLRRVRIVLRLAHLLAPGG